ncbi:putative H(+)-transporting two-sector ATPase [Helianthus anomalus]
MGENGLKKKLEGLNGLVISNPHNSNPTNSNHVFTAAPHHTPPPPFPPPSLTPPDPPPHAPSPTLPHPSPHFTCYTTYSTSVAAPSLPPPTAVAGSHDGKITDKFIGASAIRQVCEVIGVVVDVGFS